MLNRLWPLVNDRLNYLTPTIKPIGYGCSRDGQRRRLYDKPQTPLDRLLAAGVVSANSPLAGCRPPASRNGAFPRRCAHSRRVRVFSGIADVSTNRPASAEDSAATSRSQPVGV
ncbi:hypothetical protein [Candidatus Mycobacterium methanotrophicum]|uniref:hypothetical protein n=1 Tax=Candidatus Mycobacterium methanotrophicum TaxID=2943498 RepID=UPI002103C72F|nr:hypothetical protein [Candidatus Mycobacterium methanotrophicum]